MSTIKTAPLTRTLMASASLALCSATVQAATPTQADLNSIVLYGSTTIAQDSTSAWGIWDTLEPTASGPALPRVDNFSKADLYRPLAQFTLTAPAAPDDVICSSGSICGFGVFYDDFGYGGRIAEPLAVGNDSVSAEPQIDEPTAHSYAFTGVEVPAPESTQFEKAADIGSNVPSYPAAVALLSKVLRDGEFGLPDSGTLVFDGRGYYRSPQTEGDSYFYIYAMPWANDYFDAEKVQATWYYGELFKYVAGAEGQPGTATNQEFSGVAGITTSAADMSALRASGATAVYAGYDAQGYTSTPNVTMNVNFGNSTFTSTFNGGADTKTYQGTSAAGLVVGGGVGFNATGVINGSSFKATNLSATDGTVKGAVTGAFFGPSAAAAGGVADITKSRTDGTYTNGRFVSPFLVIKGLDGNSTRDRFND
jgi:hypothetical protein